ncbi:MAG: methyltransferase domain-containing protein [Candidatus Caldatribacteriaceae bacterium]
MEELREKLAQLYQFAGKHSQYQILPKIAQNMIGRTFTQTKPRFEEERLRFILENYNPLGKRILDIGGNIGFFTLEMAVRGAKQVVYYEGNETCQTFVEMLVKLLDLEDKISIRKTYFPFDDPPREQCDLVLLLNVLHHIGDDFGSKNMNRIHAKRKILDYLNILSAHTSYLVFQMGFCWKGNRNLLLFQHGTKAEMIEYICKGTEKHWRVVTIGIPEKDGEKVMYRPLNKNNIHRDDALGEFLNRPLFILEAKR